MTLCVKIFCLLFLIGLNFNAHTFDATSKFALLISYSTSVGGTASDGNERNGLYTEVLLRELQNKHLPIELLLNQVNESVKIKSKGEQIPVFEKRMFNNFCFEKCDKNYKQKNELSQGINKVALVIGNSDYKILSLKNPLNDSDDISGYLKKLGYKVLQRNNIRASEIYDTFSELKKTLSKDSVFVFYYSGHGVHLKNEDYLLAVDKEFNSSDDVEKSSLKLKDLVDLTSELKVKVNIFFIDTSRVNPFLLSK